MATLLLFKDIARAALQKWTQFRKIAQLTDTAAACRGKYSDVTKIFREGERLQDNLQGRLAFPYLPLKDDIHTMGIAGDISHEANQVVSAPGSQTCSGSSCDGWRAAASGVSSDMQRAGGGHGLEPVSEAITSSTPTSCYLITMTGGKFRSYGLHSSFLLVFPTV